jgi:NADH:ubiquinone oxidoreductase subunit 5 (subunit L)/multisubunit Na+/H+ antiporter MnhA subunit
MQDRLHQGLVSELNQTTRTDTITAIVGVVLNLIFLLVNSLIAGGVWTEEFIYTDVPRGDPMFVPEPTIVSEFNLSMMLIFVILIAAIIAINIFVIRALLAGKERRTKLSQSLEKMYEEEEIDKYYDASIIKGYETRYGLYTKIVGTLGLLAVLIPIVVLTL